MNANEDLHTAVAETMARIVAGDAAARWDLLELAEPALHRIFRAEARRIPVFLTDDDLFELSLDGVEELVRMAPAWKPGSALPWVWARLRINQLVHQHIGTFTRELDEAAIESAPAPTQPIDDPRAALRSLALRHEGAERLNRHLELVSDRDADIYLRFQVEKATGNRAPAVTVGADHDMQPAAVRKVVQRVHQRVGAHFAHAA